MKDTWGIPGPEFLGLYAIAFLISLLFLFAIRIHTRTGAAHSTPAPGALTRSEVACLTGGPRRVVEAAVAQLVDTGQLRPVSAGYVQAAAHADGTNPVERTVIADVRRYGRRSTSILTDRLAASDAVTEVTERLVRTGFLVDAGLAARRRAIGVVPMVTVLAVGVARWFAELVNDRPIGQLTMVVAAAGVVGYVMGRHEIGPRTFIGDHVARELTDELPDRTHRRHPGVSPADRTVGRGRSTGG
ncbi:TIGR04222 domain-containing membrane protein [Actinocrispum wychmicini]|uniref:Uncharacterized protein (TIGR04222 family) n=1 Tax=Actinocrispum wychmicini TaxID=1213861 RepID=A0A4R2J3C7_9PSEU|nr:TIGR04222 domain-containing membrane protein [Actinocrispum wychmicini]TCO52454.1 uncharacterized protein (TIGR04222 family) [Actinocrispum wychmicini]